MIALVCRDAPRASAQLQCADAFDASLQGCYAVAAAAIKQYCGRRGTTALPSSALESGFFVSGCLEFFLFSVQIFDSIVNLYASKCSPKKTPIFYHEHQKLCLRGKK